MAGTLVSYLPFTRSVTEDLSGKEWTVTGNPQIVIRPDFPVPVAQFGENDYIELPNITIGGQNHWMMDFWIYLPQISNTNFFLNIGTDEGSLACVWLRSDVASHGGIGFYTNGPTLKKTDNVYYQSNSTRKTYYNKWINIKLWYAAVSDSNSSQSDIYLTVWDGTQEESRNIGVSYAFSTQLGRIKIGSTKSFFISQFRFYTNPSSYITEQFMPNPNDSQLYLPTRKNFSWNELQANDIVNFDYYENIIYSAYPKSQQWIYKNIGTADDLLVSGTSLTNVSPSKSITSKAFYQTKRQKCFDTQASKEIYMLFDVYFDGTNRWRAYEESSTNGTTGITAQTSGVLNIFSNNTNVGASIPLTINKLETYLLHMISDATNGYIEVWQDQEPKYTYTGNVNNGDDFSNLELQSDGSGTVFSNVVISNQPVYDSDRWVGNYNTIQRTLSNETWVKEKCLKSYLPCTNTITEDLCGNTWTITGTSPVITTINELNGKATQFGQGYIFTNPPELKTNNFTIDWWEYIPFTVNGLTAQMVVIDGTDGTGTQCLDIGYDNGATVPSFWLGKGASSGWKYSNKVIGTKIRGQWVHRAVVRYNDKIYAFENGKLYTSFDIESNMYIDITGSSLFIGGFKRASRPFVGMLSEIRVYVGYAVWTENFTPPNQEDYFETYWYFNKPAPILNTNYDIQRTLSNETWVKEKCLKSYLPCTNTITEDFCDNIWNVTGTTPTIVTTNYLNGKATEFVNGYIYTNPPELKNNNFTIDWWEYIPSSRSSFTSEIISIDGTTGTNTNTLSISYQSSTVPYLYLGEGKSTGWVINKKQIGTKLRDQWVHRAIVRYNDTIYAFENGTCNILLVIGYDVYIDITGDSLFIGGFKRASRPFVGMLSEIRVYVGYAVWTENFTPPNQEDYFETYWYFNKPAPILNTNYDMFRSLINASKIWKYINPGYPDLCVSPQYSGITYEPLDQDSSVALTETTNIDLTNMKYITDDEIWIKWTVSHHVTIPGYSINVMNEDSEYITFYHQGIVGHFFSNVDNTDLFKQNDSQHHSFDVNNVPSGSYCILHVKSHITNGIIELFVNSDLGSIKVIQGNINAGKKFTKVNLQIDASYYSTEISNIIISTGQLTSSDKIASNLIPVQYTLTNDEEWRFAKYVLQSWMLFENSPTEDLCGNTWTAYNNPSIIDTDVLHGKALQLNSGQYLSMTNTISLGGDKDLTISGWYNMSTSSGTWASMFTFWQMANGGHIIKLSQNGTSKGLAWDFSFGTYALGTNIDNKLHHFAYVYQAKTKKISIYIDGKRLIYGSEEISRYDYKLYLGKSNYSADKAYVGTINEFKVYDGYAEFTKEFTPPIPQLVSNKLYYNKSTQTMKFEYFANVQVNIVNIAYNINRTNMFLRDYIPLHNDLEDKVGNVNPDRSDNYALIRLAEPGDIIAIESVFTNNTLDFRKYAIIYSNNNRTEEEKETCGFLSIPNINSLLNSKFILQAQLFDVKYQHNYGNSLLTNNIFSIFGQGLEQFLLMVGYTDNLLLQADVKKRYSASFSSINNFQLTVIYDYDNLHIIISSINTNTGDTKLEIVYNIDLTQSQPNFSRNINEILFGSNINTSNAYMRNAIHYLSEIKIYQDFNPKVSSDVIDNYITYQFNNNEESVYFEFYANITSNAKYLKIISQAFNKKFLIDDWNAKDNPPSSFLITQDIVDSELSDNLISADPLIPGGKYYQADIKKYNFEFKSNKTLSIGKKILFIATFLVTKIYSIVFYIDSANYSRIIINPSCNDDELQTIDASYNLGELSYINEDKVVTENNTIISVAIEIQNDSISLYMNQTLKATWNCHGILSSLFPNNTLNTTTFSIKTWSGFKLYIQRASLYDLPEGKNLMDISSDKISIIPSSSSIDPPRIAIYHNNNTYYKKLVLPTDENASKIRIYHNDTVYALSK